MAYSLKQLNAGVVLLHNAATGYASGRLIGRDLVLTVAHALWADFAKRGATAPAASGWRWRYESVAEPPPAAWGWVHPANAGPEPAAPQLVWHDPGLDMALLRLVPPPSMAPGGQPDGPGFDVRIACNPSARAHDVAFRGYPFANVDADGRSRLSAYPGKLDTETGRSFFRMVIADGYAPADPARNWRGASGSVVYLAEPNDPGTLWIYGAVVHHEAQFEQQLRVAPLQQALEQALFRDVLREFAPGMPLEAVDPLGTRVAVVPPGPTKPPPEEEAGVLEALRRFDRTEDAGPVIERIKAAAPRRAAMVRNPSIEALICAEHSQVILHFLNRIAVEISITEDVDEGHVVESLYQEELRWSPVSVDRASQQLDDLLFACREFPVRGFACEHDPESAEYLRAALASEGALRWVVVHIKNAADCTALDAAHLGRFIEYWRTATKGKAEGKRIQPSAALIFVCEGVAVVPAALETLCQGHGIPAIVLGNCDPAAFEEWEKRVLRDRDWKPSKMVRDWVLDHASALKEDAGFAQPFPIEQALTRMMGKLFGRVFRFY